MMQAFGAGAWRTLGQQGETGSAVSFPAQWEGKAARVLEPEALDAGQAAEVGQAAVAVGGCG